jgi:hypothetical protein
MALNQFMPSLYARACLVNKAMFIRINTKSLDYLYETGYKV